MIGTSRPRRTRSRVATRCSAPRRADGRADADVGAFAPFVIGAHPIGADVAEDGEALAAAEASRGMFQAQLGGAGYGEITTDIAPIDVDTEFFYAEPYHQQYLAKNPFGYCGLKGTGVACAVPAPVSA